MEGKPNPNMTQQAIKAKYVVIRDYFWIVTSRVEC